MERFIPLEPRRKRPKINYTEEKPMKKQKVEKVVRI